MDFRRVETDRKENNTSTILLFSMFNINMITTTVEYLSMCKKYIILHVPASFIISAPTTVALPP